ncbi:MAG: periplasmic heavy metal sensor [Pseudomonadota bacterium]
MSEQTTKRRAPRWMQIALVLSLCLNLLIVGAVVGAVGSGKKGGPRMGDVSFGPYTAALTREDRRALRRTIREQSEPATRGAVRETFQAFLAALRTEPLDVEEMTRVFETQGALAQARQAAGKAALLEYIAAMSPADRAAFADRLEDALRRKPGNRP